LVCEGERGECSIEIYYYYCHPLASAEILLVQQSLTFGGSSGISSAAEDWTGPVSVDDNAFINEIGKEF